MRKVLLILLLIVFVLLVGGYAWLWQADQYQRDGTIRLAVLDAPVRVVRDEQGIPYIYAQSLDDAFRAQGFVTAQDRLFQIEFTRYLSHGRLAELIGEPGLGVDIPLRVAGIPRHAERHAALLQGEERRRRELYLEGLNAYIRERADEHPVGLAILGITPQPWTLADTVTLGYFLNWSSSANLDAELTIQAIIDAVGPEKAAQITQLTVNPDDESARAAQPAKAAHLDGLQPGPWMGGEARPMQLGSNNWVMSAARSAGGAPVVVNDPHIDSRTLPGIWHPVGLITPELRAIGVAGAGIPGLAVARTDRIAYGITNSYGDAIDLFVETEDPDNPDRYLEGERSIPFEIIEDSLRILERGAGPGFRDMPLRIRVTHRGPVISDHGMGLAPGKLLALRWAVPEAMRPDDTGGTDLMLARSVAEARQIIHRVNAPYNYVVADVDGNIAHFTGGRIPIRLRGDGSTPLPVTDGTDAWGGIIPAAQMPGVVNPQRGWAGTANHRTLPADYPFAYSTYFASSWRYRRMMELLDGPNAISAEDHWRFMRDSKNTMAAKLAPIMAEALATDDDTREMADLLRAWDAMDDPDAVAPTIFQVTYRQFARLTFEDELGQDVAARMLEGYYFWQERLARLCRENTNAWFDDVTTDAPETRDDLFRRAALLARDELTERFGPNLQSWQWGKLHTVTFFSPIIPGKFAAGLLGGGTAPKDGSGETINRATYRYGEPYDSVYIASMRFVADLADPDKVMAVVSGGVSGRQFSPHLKDQLDAWLSGEPGYWWFSDAAISAHIRHEQRLEP
ncbi:MAG: penicillin acylase family protein [Gammaproteobacteria bacterium]|nr:penicillin acylase family protein [Gammaproteobacteria bacterium]